MSPRTGSSKWRRGASKQQELFSDDFQRQEHQKHKKKRGNKEQKSPGDKNRKEAHRNKRKNDVVGSIFGPIRPGAQKKRPPPQNDTTKGRKRNRAEPSIDNDVVVEDDKRPKAKKRKKTSSSGEKPPQKRKRKNKFRLLLPGDKTGRSRSNNDVCGPRVRPPWKMEDDDHLDTCACRCDEQSSKTPLPAWNALTQELQQFAAYVQLSEDEVALRRGFCRHIQRISENLFAERARDRLPKFPSKYDIENATVRIQVFGSFSTLQVCTFQSDVDMALWGVVPVEQPATHIRYADAATPTKKKLPEDSNGGVEGAAGSNLRLEQVQARELSEDKQARKKERIQKWAEALEAIDDEKFERSQKPAKRDDPRGQDQTGAALADVEDCELFQIDRTGDVTQSPPESASSLAEPPTATPTTTEESSSSRGDANDVIAEESDSDVDTANPLQGSSTPATRTAVVSPPTKWQNESDTDDEDWHQPKRTSHLVRESMSLKEDDDDDDIVVSFTATRRSSSSRGLVGIGNNTPTGRIKRDCNDTLRRLLQALRKKKNPWEQGTEEGNPPPATTPRYRFANHNSEHIRNARVPIIKLNMMSRWGFEADVCIGGHNGSDTSLYAAEQCQLYPGLFAPIVLFIKVLLTSQNLDQPFTGGLGSYKLYVLVALHLRKAHDMKNQANSDCSSCSLGRLLMSFLYRYGGVQDNDSSWQSRRQLTTELTRDSILYHHETGEELANFCGVHKIDHVVDLFEECYLRLSERLENNDSCSLLSCVLDAQELQSLRSSHLQMASEALSEIRAEHQSSEEQEVTDGGGTACLLKAADSQKREKQEGPARLQRKKKKRRLRTDDDDDADYPRELTAAELAAGYDADIVSLYD